MSDIDELLEELTGSGGEPGASPGAPLAAATPPSRAPRPFLTTVVVAAMVGALAVIGVVGYAAFGRDRSDPSVSASPAVVTTALVPAPTIGSTAAEDAGSTTTAPSEPEAEVGPRTDVIEGQQLHLRGAVPSRAVADRLVAARAALLGPDRVVDELVIDPLAPVDQATVLSVGQPVLFDFNSIEPKESDVGLLLTVARLLIANPDLTVRVVSHTDSIGSVEQNQTVAMQRAEAVCNHFVLAGVPVEQVILDPRGASDVVRGTAPERSVELVFDGTMSS